VVTAPSSKTSYVVVGREPGQSKLAKIKQFSLKTVDEDGLFSLIESQPSQVDSAQTQSKSSPPQKKTIKAKTQLVVPPVSAMSLDRPVSGSNELWTVKYAPTSLKDIIGNPGNMKSLTRWLSEW
jgi:replication factor C subunit 1